MLDTITKSQWELLAFGNKCHTKYCIIKPTQYSLFSLSFCAILFTLQCGRQCRQKCQFSTEQNKDIGFISIIENES